MVVSSPSVVMPVRHSARRRRCNPGSRISFRSWSGIRRHAETEREQNHRQRSKNAVHVFLISPSLFVFHIQVSVLLLVSAEAPDDLLFWQRLYHQPILRAFAIRRVFGLEVLRLVRISEASSQRMQSCHARTGFGGPPEGLTRVVDEGFP
jgi:hypothetical protein